MYRDEKGWGEISGRRREREREREREIGYYLASYEDDLVLCVGGRPEGDGGAVFVGL